MLHGCGLFEGDIQQRAVSSKFVPCYPGWHQGLGFRARRTEVSAPSALQVDGWAEFRAPARIGVLVRELRAGVAMLLGRKVLSWS